MDTNNQLKGTCQTTYQVMLSDIDTDNEDNVTVRIDEKALKSQVNELSNLKNKPRKKYRVCNDKQHHYSADPIRNLDDIEKIKNYLLNRPERYKGTNLKYYTYFVCGINNILRISDLSKIKIGDILKRDGSIKDEFKIIEKKTHKTNTIYINDSMKKAIKEYLSSLKFFEYDDYLFSRRGNSKQPMSRQSFWNILNEVKEVLDLDYTLSCHSTRKTFAYQSMMKNKDKAAFMLAILQNMFKHSKQTITMRCIGLQADDERNIYESLCL